jgi:kinesin family protein 5
VSDARSGFTFDRVFDTETRQDEIFDWGVKNIVEGELTIDRQPRELS